MGKNLVKLLSGARAEGVSIGMITHKYLTQISEDNVLKDRLPEDQLGAVLHELEVERDRIWAEIVESTEGKKKQADEMAELLVGHAERIRRERGMD